MATFSDDHVQKLLLGPRVISRGVFPGTEGENAIAFGVRVLSEEEIDMARLEAHSHIDSKCKLARTEIERFVKVDPDALEREFRRQCLALACVDADSSPDKAVPFFQSAKQVRKLPSTVVDKLWSIYLDHHAAMNPTISLDAEQVRELCEALKKESSAAVILDGYEPSTLRSLLRTMADQLRSSLASSSSTSAD